MNHTLIEEIEQLLKPLSIKIKSFTINIDPNRPGAANISLDGVMLTQYLDGTRPKPDNRATCDGMFGHLNDCMCFEDESLFDQRD